MPNETKASLAWETPESNRGSVHASSRNDPAADRLRSYVAQGRERVTQATDPAEILRLRNESPGPSPCHSRKPTLTRADRLQGDI